MSAREYIRAFAESFGQSEFSAAIIKWTPLIESTVYKIAKLTRQDAEDVRQGLLMELAAVADYFASDLFRYKNRVWRLKQKSGRIALIESPVHIVKRMEPRWLYWSWLTPVKKSSASAFVYRVITQFLPDAATKHFRQRNGFELTRVKRSVIEKAGNTRGLKEREVYVPVQKYRHVSVDLQSVLDLSAIGYNPEELCLANHVLEGTSVPVQKVAKLLLTSGTTSNRLMGKKAKLGARQVAQAKVELVRKLKKQKYPEGCTPVYFGAEQML